MLCRVALGTHVVPCLPLLGLTNTCGSLFPTFICTLTFEEELTIPPGADTPYNGLYGEAPPERGTFFRLQVQKRVGISQVEVSKRVGKSVI